MSNKKNLEKTEAYIILAEAEGNGHSREIINKMNDVVQKNLAIEIEHKLYSRKFSVSKEEYELFIPA